MYYRIFFIVIVFIFSGCKDKSCNLPDEIESIPVSLKIDRLENAFFDINSKAEVAQFLNNNPLFAAHFLQRNQYPDDSLLINSLYGLATNGALDTLAQEAGKKFSDLDDEKQQLETAFKVIKYYYPDFFVPEVKTFVSGLSQDLLVSDSLLVFGIDFFIGKDAKYKPNVYEYIQKRYERPNMVPAALLLLSNKFNDTNLKERNLLSEMINTGKAYYFVETVLPCAPDSVIIGYSGQTIADVYHNEGRIWAHFIEKSLLYDRNPFILSKYIGERPSTPEIDSSAPGRIGTWVGWQIVRKYMERNPKVTLRELMAETNYQKIFNESKYKPEKR
jgi:gliding motility-associated lipoprotein GldB